VNHPQLQRPGADHVVVLQKRVELGRPRRRAHSEHGRLHRQDRIEKRVPLVNARRGPRAHLQLGRRADVIDVRVRVHDRFGDETVLGEAGRDLVEVATGVDHDRAVGDLVAEDGAVAAEGTGGEGFDDHWWAPGRGR
jgi:hypothetical protein